MTTNDPRRQVRLDRLRNSHYSATNVRGGTIAVGDGSDDSFTPVELLLAGLGGCTAIDVDLVTSRRAEPDSFQVTVQATKVRDEQGNHLADIVMTFKIAFPEGEAGDSARAVLPDIVKKSHDRLCTVSRTVQLGTPVTALIDSDARDG